MEPLTNDISYPYYDFCPDCNESKNMQLTYCNACKNTRNIMNLIYKTNFKYENIMKTFKLFPKDIEKIIIEYWEFT